MLAISGSGDRTRREASGANGGCAAPKGALRVWCPTIGLGDAPNATSAKRGQRPSARAWAWEGLYRRITRTSVN